jgi:hypothetical protein
MPPLRWSSNEPTKDDARWVEHSKRLTTLQAPPSGLVSLLPTAHLCISPDFISPDFISPYPETMRLPYAFFHFS